MSEFVQLPDPVAPAPEDRWIAAGRSPVTAAVIALVGIGSFYFVMQVVFWIVGMAVSVHDVGRLMALRDALSDGSEQGMDLLIGPLRWAVMLSQYAALAIPVLLLVRRWHTPHVRTYLRLHGAPAGEVLMAVLGTVLIIPIGAFVNNSLHPSTPEASDLERLMEKIFTAHSVPEFAFLVFVVAVTPAICEEIFFRGYVQRTFERTMGSRSVPLVGVIFGMFHMQPAGLVTLTMIGMWLGFVYNRSKAMLPNMAAHFTNNFIALWLVYQAPVVFGVNLQQDDQLPAAWALIAAPLFAVVVWGYWRATRRHEADEPGAA